MLTVFGPLEEKAAIRGAGVMFNTASGVEIRPFGFLKLRKSIQK